MKAKDLTQADVGKWVTLRGEISGLQDYGVEICIDGELDEGGRRFPSTFNFDANLEFTTPPEPIQEVGDVFRFIGNGAEWTISMVDGSACLLRYLTGHISADYPLNSNQWEFVRKGTVA